ncbi:MAG TPA: glycoside hydrolase family 15 protein, partial [Thermomicrobiales bacterium]|nr:glycoside hydrolase family 15 protein [Thermomicrobiales bacterium]
CLPHFDSPAVLCRILDVDRGGYLATPPAAPVIRRRRRYRDDSNVLETTLETAAGRLRLTDAMPVADDVDGEPLDGHWDGHSHGRHRLARLIEALDGPLDVALTARLSFDFTATPAQFQMAPGGAIVSDGAARRLALVWPGPLAEAPPGTVTSHVTVKPGEPVALALAHARDEAQARTILVEDDWPAHLAATDEAWKHWASCCVPKGPYGDIILRSALTLRLLTFEPTGALVAAPTTSLPEVIGGTRNWDYRYCWLRDATLTLYALLLVGDRSAARAFWDWIERTCAADPPERIQIMYGLHGERELPERIVPQLSGYRDSRPVRVGNAAWSQHQSDIYGEVLDAYWFYYHTVGAPAAPSPLDPKMWRFLSGLANHICRAWRSPDQGLWEIRSAPRHFVYSKVMCWVGLDRALKLAEAAGRDDIGADWAATRDAIREDVLAKGYNPKLGSFTMTYGGDDVGAALLRLPLVGFLPATDPRMRGTIELIQQRLQRNGLLLRYATHDGLPGAEGAFSICTFWLVDCLTELGRLDEAKALFDAMLHYANDLGLFAEEIDSATGAALGNFPQAFTHLALIDAGVDLSAALAERMPPEGAATGRVKEVRRDEAISETAPG